MKKIAIFRALQLGDILCTVPAIRAIRYAYPNSHITFIGLPDSAALIKRFPMYIDDFVTFPGYPGLPEQPFNAEHFDIFIHQMQLRQFDLLLQMQGNGSIVNRMLQMLKARRLAGFCQQKEEENASFLKYPNHSHEIYRHLALIQHIGISPQGPHMEFPITLSDIEELQRLQLHLTPGSYVCIHPGSRGAWRQWPPVYFASLGDYCASMGHNVVLTGTRDELKLTNQVAALMQYKPIIATGRTSLGAVAALLKRAFALIANCTGVSHVAAALEVPSVIISMDGEPHRWGPLNKKLHHTIDWTKDQDYELVFKKVEALYAVSN
jgi:ADP-heptose:LPS heptosyltransferase